MPLTFISMLSSHPLPVSQLKDLPLKILYTDNMLGNLFGSD